MDRDVFSISPRSRHGRDDVRGKDHQWAPLRKGLISGLESGVRPGRAPSRDVGVGHGTVELGESAKAV